MTTSTEQPTAGLSDDVEDVERWRGCGIGMQVVVLAGRSLGPVFAPSRIFFSLLQPLVMLLLFSQVFQSIAETPFFPKNVNYVDFLIPAILVVTGTSVAVGAGVGLSADMKNGVLARLRAMPVSGVSILLARSIADLARGVVELTVLLITAVIVFGFSAPGGVLGVLGAMALALAIAWSLGWVFLAAATWLRGAQNVQTVSIMFLMILQFGSSAFVPVEGLPGYMQTFAQVNPLTHGINAAREMVLGNGVGTGLLNSLGICAVFAVIGAFLAVRGMRRE